MIQDITKAEFIAEYRKWLLRLQKACQELEQVELPLIHDFGPGLYLRRILMRKDTFVIGKTHKTKHFNIVLAGMANVMIDGEIQRIQAGDVFISEPGVKKVLWILEDMIWMTPHPTDETDMDKLEKMIVCSKEEELALINAEVKEIA